ncbi:uncharacterized protein LOC143344612 [Colletes latitarsis]|uniref:uncharacterized protein LOC143344612 n=1 Tax=Colletes latitarsis TaxID=2605962 RepID=UPI0040355A66
MANQQNEKDLSLNSSSPKSLNSSFSLKRKSIHVQNALPENNDDEERLAFHRGMNVNNTSTKKLTETSKRQSLGLACLAQISAPEITDRIYECIKLNSENKITAKNAFSLEMIDLMTYMIKKQDVNISNLQVASTSLDVSAKIYGFRVDSVYTEMLKLVGGLDKEKNETPIDDYHEDTNNVQGNKIYDVEKIKQIKSKKRKQKIFSSVNDLKGTVETIKPSSWLMDQQDTQTTDALYQVVLPIHANSKFYLHRHNDIIVDTVESKRNIKDIKVNIPQIEHFSELSICPPLVNFEFCGSTNNKDEEEENRFHFDLDASLPSEDEAIQPDVYDDENNVEKCMEAREPLEEVVDFCKLVTRTEATEMSEYSFFRKGTSSHWVGPAHWKMHNFKKLFGESRVIEKCHLERGTKRKEIELSYDGDTKQAILPKFSSVPASRVEIRYARAKWQEEILTLPRDMNYNIESVTKLYLHKLIPNLRNKDKLNTTHASDIDNYNYNNENDSINYCPNEDYVTNENNDNDVAEMIFTEDNLVAAPKLTNKISIAYSTREKKIDMKELKECIWKLLDSNNDSIGVNTENAVQQETENKIKDNTYFSDVYKRLPDVLTKTNVEALTVPLSFVSLLHLASERNLEIQSLPDMSDLIVVANKEYVVIETYYFGITKHIYFFFSSIFILYSYLWKIITLKNIADMKIDAAVDTPATSMSPLRRKSVLSRKSSDIPVLLENDDEAERLVFRRESNAASMPIIKNTSGRRSSIGLNSLVNVPTSQMTEHISQCIKLGTENKINPRNAFNLKIIDFMAYLIKRRDDKMNNLQVASTSLDVSTQIYGFRVDGVHTQILKMMDGMDIGEKNNMNANTMDVNGESEDQLEKPAKKKKKKNKQYILSTVENLRTNVETRKPSLVTMEEDLQSTDMLRQITLPIHANSRFYLHPYNDILVDLVDYKRIQSKDISCSTLRVGDLSNMQICPPLHHFNFQNFNEDDEIENDLPEQTNESRFQFDLDASISQDEEHPCTNINYFNVEENEEENVNRYTKHPDQVQNLVDFQEVLSNSVPTKVSEYSFIPKNLNLHWAIPTYWRNTNFRKILTNSEVVGTCHQAPIKKKKEIELCYNDDTVNSVNDKFLPRKGITLNRKRVNIDWKEEILTLPPDKHYDVAQTSKLYLNTIIFKHPEKGEKINTTCLSDVDYNYDNESEIICNSGLDNNECRETEENNVVDNVTRPEDEHMTESQPFTGNNLVTAPKLTNKSSINYCVREKKIDMGQLKKSIWKCLTTDDSEKIANAQASKENVQQSVCDKMNDKKYFSEIYKKLPNILTKDNSKELSYPIAFVSLLHLANEKSLKITSSPDVFDLTIEQD